MGFWTIFLFVASTAYTINRQNAAKKKAAAARDKAAGFEVTVEKRPIHLSRVYGRGAVAGVRSQHSVSNELTIVAAPAGFTEFKAGGAFAVGGPYTQANKKEYLSVQQAFCVGGLNNIIDLTVNDHTFDSSDARFTHLIRIDLDGGTADPNMSSTGIKNANTNIFGGCAWASSTFILDRDDPQYNGVVPDVRLWYEGTKVHSIDYDSQAGTYSLSATKAYSHNSALCLLDYMTAPVKDGGCGFNIGEFNLASFYNAANLSGTVVVQNSEVRGRLNGIQPVKDGEAEPAAATRDLNLYECHLQIDTDEARRDNINRIIETMNGANLVWSNGQYKLICEYPTNQTQADALVTANYTDDNVIKGTNFEVVYPSAGDRLQRATVKFTNESTDLVQDSVAWPDRDSAVYTSYLAQDNNIESEIEVEFEGCINRKLAKAKAEYLVRSSRSRKTVSFTIETSGLVHEQGDFIRLNSTIANISNEIFQIEKVKPTSDNRIEIIANSFDYNDLAWNVNDDYVEPVTTYYSSTVPNPTALTWNSGSRVGGASNGYLTWTAPEGMRGFHIYTRLSSESTYTNLGETTEAFFDIPAEYNDGLDRYFMVKTLAPNGRLSTGAIVLADVMPNLVPVTNIQKYKTGAGVRLTWDNANPELVSAYKVWVHTADVRGSATLYATITGTAIELTDLPLQNHYVWIDAHGYGGAVAAQSSATTITAIDLHVEGSKLDANTVAWSSLALQVRDSIDSSGDASASATAAEAAKIAAQAAETGAVAAQGVAVTASQDSQNSADAAATSQQAAFTSETNAGTSAAAASTSEVAASTSEQGALLSALALLPSTFEEDGKYFTSSTAGAPGTVSLNDWNFKNVTEGRVAYRAAANGLKYIYPEGVISPQAGRTYRLTVRAKTNGTVTGSPHISLFFRELDSSYVYQSVHNFTSFSLTSTMADYVVEFTPSSDIPFCRAGMYTRNDLTGSGEIWVLSIKIDDVTSEIAASGSASAAATSASTAQASETAAGSSASAASASETAASTSAGQASVSESAAAVSATTANDAAAAASSHSGVAAQMTSSPSFTNPIFLDWSGTYPAGFTNQSVSEGAINKVSGDYGNALQMDSAGTPTGNLPYIQIRNTSAECKLRNADDCLGVEISAEIIKRGGQWASGACIRVRWKSGGTGGNDVSDYMFLEDFRSNEVSGDSLLMEKIVMRPDNYVPGDADGVVQVQLHACSNFDGKTRANMKWDLQRISLKEVTSASSAYIQQTAVTDLQGNAAASLVFRAKAGGGSGAVEIVAANDAEGGTASQVNISADEMLFTDGVAMFGGDLQSTGYVANTSGWQISANGAAEFKSLATREWLVDGAASEFGLKENYVTAAHKGSSVGLGSLNLGVIHPTAFWQVAFATKFRASYKVHGAYNQKELQTPVWEYSTRILYQYRVKNSGSWGSWITVHTTGYNTSPTSWAQAKYVMSINDDADDMQVRAYAEIAQTNFYNSPGDSSSTGTVTYNNVFENTYIGRSLIR